LGAGKEDFLNYSLGKLIGFKEGQVKGVNSFLKDYQIGGFTFI